MATERLFDWRELATSALVSMLFWLTVSVAAYFGWAALLSYTLLSGDTATTILLTTSSLLLIAALRHARLQRARRALLAVPRTQWRDGDAVAVVGRLGAGQVALRGPVSDQPCALYQHQMRRWNNSTRLEYGRGLRLADAALATDLGSIELKGLPTLDDVTETQHRDLPALQTYARHLLCGAVELADDANVIEVLGTSAKLRAGIELITGRSRNADGQIAHELVRPKHMLLLRDPIPWDEAKALRDRGQVDDAATRLAAAMQGARCEVSEQILAAGTEVCVFGTWCASDQRLAIGPSPKPDREHRVIGLGRTAWLAANRRAVTWRIGLSLGLLLALLVPLGVALSPSMDGRPWHSDLVSLPQFWHAIRGNSEAIRPLLGSTTRPDAVAKALEAGRAAEYLRVVRASGATEPPPRSPEPPEADRLRAIEALLHFDIDLDAPDANGRMLLMDTRGDTLELLLRHGADPRSAGADGWTALHAAVGAIDPQRVEVLLRAGADPLARDRHGYTPLDHARADAAHSRNPDQQPYFEQVIALLQAAIPTSMSPE